ncbi:hypothetical protein HY411_00135 [Candidatus Gottesmanbacteria bacterium]|nr:hypothetical protein [Candidatus Gottesmanbacteria bacterium]
MPIRVFVDSDVIISSLISQTGAAYLLMHDERIARFVSDVSFSELKRVTGVLHLSQEDLRKLVQTRCDVVVIGDRKNELTRMAQYARDSGDAHIVLGGKLAKAKFLVTYNTKAASPDNISNSLKVDAAQGAVSQNNKRRYFGTPPMHYRSEKVREDMGIILLPPAFLLQYLRCLN